MKKRLDLILVERGLFDTREKAKREIMAGNVIVNEQAVTKAGTNFKDTDELSIRIKDRLKYVSRGGLKLEKAIKIWNLDFKDKIMTGYRSIYRRFYRLCIAEWSQESLWCGCWNKSA